MFKNIVLLLLLTHASASVAESYETDNFTIRYDENVPEKVVTQLAQRIETNRKLVLAFLNRSPEYRGTPITEHLVVYISKTKRTPYQDWNSIHIPEKRVLAAFSNAENKNSGMAVIHELTHVYAVSAYRKQKKNGFEDRFYDDGLAVYLQHQFGETPEYPDFGESLYRAVAMNAQKYGALIPLEKAEDIRHSAKTGVGRKLAYLQEGAFTQFLIETYGLSAYLRIYNGENPKAVTDKSFQQLEQDWQSFLNLFDIS